MITLNDILQNRGVSTLDTIHIAGREISLAQKPHVEADVARAKTVLTRLLACSSRENSEPVSVVISVVRARIR